ncbi:MAG: hypothetical protein R3200_10875 [Xanthomonadales bacterium]|nr:hypothetical protein [Xanthomonadales bacterium]
MLEILLIFSLTAQPEVLVGESQATRAEMHERFTRATLIQTAIINGNLEGARHWAKQLATIAPKEPAFADVRSRFAALAGEIAEARTLSQAAFKTGRLANSCGACHELHGIQSFRFESSTPAPDGKTVPEAMARHIWAADRLWEGLVGRSEGSWMAGASALVKSSLEPAQLENPDQETIALLAEKVRESGSEALQSARWESRAALYGRLLNTCAECHKSYR